MTTWDPRDVLLALGLGITWGLGYCSAWVVTRIMQHVTKEEA